MLGDKKEYNRLTKLLDSAHNTYDKRTEVILLDDLNNILLTGIDSKLIYSIQRLHDFIIAHYIMRGYKERLRIAQNVRLDVED